MQSGVKFRVDSVRLAEIECAADAGTCNADGGGEGCCTCAEQGCE
jgi:hypothetical protein